jgi:hypothetical protein
MSIQPTVLKFALGVVFSEFGISIGLVVQTVDAISIAIAMQRSTF